MVRVFFWDSNRNRRLTLKKQDKIRTISLTSTASPATLLFWAPFSPLRGSQNHRQNGGFPPLCPWFCFKSSEAIWGHLTPFGAMTVGHDAP
jgi:hypothetical protein